MTQLHHIDTPANHISDVMQYMQSRSMTLFSFDRLEQELLSMQRFLPEPSELGDVNAFINFMDEIAPSLGQNPESDTVQACFQSTTLTVQRMLAARCKGALNAIAQGRHTVDSQSSPTAILVPTAFSSRFEMLLGRSTVPLVWVRSLDCLEF